MTAQHHHQHPATPGGGTTTRHLTSHPGGRARHQQTDAIPAATAPTGIGDGVTIDHCPEEPLIGLRVLSVWLGVSESTVRKWAARGPGTGLLPTMIRVNGQLRFRPEDVRTYLREKELR